ncbi:hypothetical protein EPN29_11520 [bacterium]|nr:MAG: hypothetical protein EPN29_11520 [bacterium]
MRHALLLGLLLVTAACGAYRFPGVEPGGSGTVSGNVVAVPCAPVESAAKPCAGRPVPGLELDFTSGDTTRGAVTDSEGNYSIELGAATWKVRMKTYMRIVSGPPAVTVTSGSRLIVSYVLDSGIRVPVPQQ